MPKDKESKHTHDECRKLLEALVDVCNIEEHEFLKRIMNKALNSIESNEEAFEVLEEMIYESS